MAGRGAGNPRIGPLYVKMLEDRPGLIPGARDIFGALSQTSQFKVCLHLTSGGVSGSLMSHLSSAGVFNDAQDAVLYDFYCAEAALPGATFSTFEETGSYQGVREVFPGLRDYPPFSITLYVDNQYKIIRLFEEWMNFINPVYSLGGDRYAANPSGQGNYKDSNNFYRLRYPNEYRRIISITKFERDFVSVGSTNYNLNTGGIARQPSSITYRMIDSFPTNITAIPVTYEGSTITKTTIQFSYSRYVIENHNPTNV